MAEFTGTAGDDSLVGTDEDDDFRFSLGNDTLIGGAGTDRLLGNWELDQAEAPARLEIDLTAGRLSTPDATQTLSGIENISIRGLTEVTLRGDAGDNKLSIDLGSGLIEAGGGDDTVYWRGEGGAVAVSGGDGQDRLHLPGAYGFWTFTRNAEGQLVLEGDEDGATLTLLDAFESYYFSLSGRTQSHNVVSATLEDDSILGTDGNDSFQFSPGNDTLVGGAGTDHLSNVFAYSLPSGTVLDLAAGTLIAPEYTQTLESIENLELYGAGNTTISGTDGDNSLGVNEARNALFLTRGGDDDIFLFVENSTLHAGAGDDTISYTATDSHLHGNSGNDLFRMEGTDSTLYGGAGHDTFAVDGSYLSNSIDDPDSTITIEGGAGQDRLDLSFLALEDLSVRTNPQGGLVLSWTHEIVRGPITSTLILLDAVELFEFAQSTTLTYAQLAGRVAGVSGTEAADVITSTTGDDQINALGGNDWITTGGGEDTIDGGAGIDMLSFADLGRLGVSINLAEGRALVLNGDRQSLSHIENLTGTSGADNLTGDAGANLIRGLGGRDLFFATAGGDLLQGGGGADLLRAGAFHESEDNSVSLLRGRIWEGEGAGTRFTSIEHLRTGGGDDQLTGDHGANRLEGNYGNDTLMGNGGDDLIYGGFGNDVALYSYAQDQYAITTAGEVTTVSYIGAGAGDGTDLLLQIENLRFADGDVLL